MNVYEYFRENFKRAPESEALVGDSRFTYAELDERAGEIAGWVDSNTSDGGRVAVLMHDCPEYVAVVLGIWRAGRVACPVNTMLSPDETEYVIRNSDAGTVVHSDVLGTTAEEMADRVGASAVGVGELDASHVEVATSSDDDTAMVMHTSGTTGRPKGVVHTHRNITAQVECGVSFARLGRDDTVAVPVPLFHVGGFHVGVLMSLFSGGTVAVQEWWNAEDWARIVEETGATVTGMVPTMMVDVIETEAVQEYDVSSLRLCLYGGSSASASVVERFRNDLGVDKLFDFYGLTETAGLAVSYDLDDEPEEGSMGRVIPAVESTVVDTESRHEVDEGGRGELLLRGDTVTPGYLNDDLNDEGFERRDRERWLRTGDVVRREGDYLYYVERVDDMVLTGGEKVAPNNVEEVIEQHPDVEIAAVYGTSHERYGEAVTASVVGDVDEEEIASFCEERDDLAAYKTPKRVEVVESLPRTATGKPDKKKLAKEFEVED